MHLLTARLIAVQSLQCTAAPFTVAQHSRSDGHDTDTQKYRGIVVIIIIIMFIHHKLVEKYSCKQLMFKI